MALTVKRLAKLGPGRYRDERGLYVQIRSPSNQSWLLRFQLEGRERWMGLGSLADFNLSEARERARKARQLLADKIDPLEARKAERASRALASAKAMSFEEAAKKYHEAHDKKWASRKHAAQFLASLEAYAFPKIGKLPVSDIDIGRVLAVLEPIWTTKTETASRVRQRIEAVLGWAAVRGFRTGDNPARWKGNLDTQLAPRSEIAPSKHHAAMPYSEVGAFVAELRNRPAIAARALEFAILTATRTGEVIGARWEEIDLDKAVWTIPASRMKARVQHRVPLAPRAVEILRKMPRESDFVFPGGTKGSALSNMGMSMLLRRMDVPPEKAVVHGFRSSFRDWSAEQTAFPNHVAEMALAHVIDSKVEAAYRRGDLFSKRAQLMNAWARYVEAPPRAAETNVTALRR